MKKKGQRRHQSHSTKEMTRGQQKRRKIKHPHTEGDTSKKKSDKGGLKGGQPERKEGLNERGQ